MSRLRRAAAAATVLAATGGAVALPIASASAASSHAVTVKLSDFKVTPSAKSAKAGKITFTVKNSAMMEHELVVIRTNKKAADLAKGGGKASESGSKGEVELKGGQTKKLTLNLKKGHYALICNIGGHYMAGMHADFTVN
jgi:uncharacterized cupredoxin-like copper-binding protein